MCPLQKCILGNLVSFVCGRGQISEVATRSEGFYLPLGRTACPAPEFDGPVMMFPGEAVCLESLGDFLCHFLERYFIGEIREDVVDPQ